MKKLRFGLLAVAILGLIIVGYLGAANLPFIGRPPHHDEPMIEPPNPDELRTYFTIRAIVSTVNAGLTIYLLMVYVGIYLKTRAKFTVGLIIFTITLLLYALTSNPLLVVLVTARPFAFGIFAGVSELFTTIALIVLLYLSLE